MKTLSRQREAVSALLVASGAEGKGTDGASGHRIIVFLVRLHVLAILNATVFVVVDAKASTDGSRAEVLGAACLFYPSHVTDDRTRA